MLRLLFAFSALTFAFGTLSAGGGMPTSARATTPATIGKDRPVFLGRMVVTATPLPDHGR